MYTGHRKMAADSRINATAMKKLDPGGREAEVKQKLNPLCCESVSSGEWVNTVKVDGSSSRASLIHISFFTQAGE